MAIQIGSLPTYHPDRFYVNEMGLCSGEVHGPSGVPLFSRGRLVNAYAEQGDLKGVILTTYNLDLPDVKEEFHTLFEKDIPLLLLHGDKRVHREYRAIDEPYQVSKSLQTFGQSLRKAHWNELVHPHCQVEEVVAHFAPIDSGGKRKRNEENHSETERSRGSTHPKYMILITSTDLILAISTANINEEQSIDITWCQKFKRGSDPAACSNDFGLVLQDFLDKTSQSMKLATIHEGQKGTIASTILANTPTCWMRRVLGIDNLSSSFIFSEAKVYLISSVPIEVHSRDMKILYGQQRIQQLLERHAPALGRKLCPRDKLFLQPTSIGDNITDNLDLILESLVPEEWEGDDDWEDRTSHARIVWPSYRYIKKTRRFPFKYRSDIEENQFPDWSKETVGGVIFFKPDTFQGLTPDQRAIMQKFEMHSPLKQLIDTSRGMGHPEWTKIAPHVKSIFRILAKDNSKTVPASPDLAWFILTSANLSRGALGFLGSNGVFSCRNFELGVLFHSSKEEGVQYRAKDWQNHLGEEEEEGIIELPIPYRLDSDMYSASPDAPDKFMDVPFFHQLRNCRTHAASYQFEGMLNKIYQEYRDDCKWMHDHRQQ